MTITITLDKTGINDTTDQALNTNLLALATSVEGVFNDMFNGVQPFDRVLFTAAANMTIANGILDAPPQALITINTEGGLATDFLDTINVSNNRFALFKAAVGQTVYIRSGFGNITTSDGSVLTMTGNILIMAWCIGSQWAVIGNGTGGSAVPSNLNSLVDPTPSDDTPDYTQGSLWANTADDSMYVNLDNLPNAAIWKLITPPRNEWGVRASGVSALGMGIPNPTVANTPASANDANNIFITLPTTAVLGNLGGFITTTLNLVRPAHDFILEVIVKTDADITNQRLWIGLIDADLTNVDTLAAGREFIGWRFSTVAPDTGWRPVLNDGTTQNTGAAIGTVAASTVYKLKARVVSGGTPTVFFSVNDGAETALTTNFPPSTQDLGLVVRCIDTTAAIRLLNFCSARVYWT